MMVRLAWKLLIVALAMIVAGCGSLAAETSSDDPDQVVGSVECAKEDLIAHYQVAVGPPYESGPETPEAALDRFFGSEPALDSVPVMEFAREKPAPESGQMLLIHQDGDKRNAEVIVEERERRWFVVDALLCQEFIDESETPTQ